MSQINRVPYGLQSLLQSKTFGKNPQDLSDTVQPVIDMLPFLQSEQVFYHREESNLSAVGQAVVVDIPDGEIWLPFWMSFKLNGANDAGVVWSARFSLARVVNSNSPASEHEFHFTDQFTVVNVGQVQGDSHQWQFRVPLFSDMRLRVVLSEYVPGATGNDDFVTTVSYLKLDV